jgi:hypothetical protein
MVYRKKPIKIVEDDLKFIYGDDYIFFRQKILPNCFCSSCSKEGADSIVTITNYEIFINDINDVLLEGFCLVCGGRVGRYSETGEVKKYVSRVLKIKRKYKKGKIIK